MCVASPAISLPYLRGTWLIIDGSTLPHHSHLESVFTLGFMLGVVHSMGLDKFIMTSIYTVRESFHCPKNPLLFQGSSV